MDEGNSAACGLANRKAGPREGRLFCHLSAVFTLGLVTDLVMLPLVPNAGGVKVRVKVFGVTDSG
jgi:hypothetical protein